MLAETRPAYLGRLGREANVVMGSRRQSPTTAEMWPDIHPHQQKSARQARVGCHAARPAGSPPDLHVGARGKFQRLQLSRRNASDRKRGEKPASQPKRRRCRNSLRPDASRLACPLSAPFLFHCRRPPGIYLFGTGVQLQPGNRHASGPPPTAWLRGGGAGSDLTVLNLSC